MIRVLVDDLAFLPVDAVLRPANDTLDPTTPAISRLDHQAGSEFARQRQVLSPLDVGAAVVTGAGALPAQFVVHLVIQSQERSVGRETVRRALTSAWQRAADWKLDRVATPLIGAGAGGLTIEEAAELLAETFRQRLGAPWPSDLSIVVERPEDQQVVEAVLGRAGT
ncbi:MAG TPA: macro domain-containing protein [Gemmatimonadales bacterium]|nr:macro domain-containing protein [Gemmatimonadales bacterium]